MRIQVQEKTERLAQKNKMKRLYIYKLIVFADELQIHGITATFRNSGQSSNPTRVSIPLRKILYCVAHLVNFTPVLVQSYEKTKDHLLEDHIISKDIQIATLYCMSISYMELKCQMQKSWKKSMRGTYVYVNEQRSTGILYMVNP